MAKKKREIPILALKIRALGLPRGHVAVPDLITICEEAQRAITRQAEALEGRRTGHPGPSAASILRDCTLELIGLRKGSTTLQFGLAKTQRDLPFEDYGHFGSDVVRQLAETIKCLGNGDSTVRGELDEGVLQSLYKLGSIVEGEKSVTFEWIAPSHGGQKRIAAKYGKLTRQAIASRLSQPRKAIMRINGILEMADFKPSDRKCRIDPPIGAPVICSFGPESEDEVYALMRKPVSATGVATLQPNTRKVDVLSIEKIEPLPSLALGEGNFFALHSLDDLAESQKVRPIRNSSTLAGGIPDSEDIDEFLREIYESRK